MEQMRNRSISVVLRWIWGLGAIVALGLVVYWLKRPSIPSEVLELTQSRQKIQTNANQASRLNKPKPPSEDFVGSVTCAECHKEISEAYRHHPMAQTLSRISDAQTVEDYENQVTFSPGGPTQYRVERANDAVLHHEILLNSRNETVYDQKVEVQFAVGSGHRGRSYLINRGGIFYMSPVTWYSQGQQWGLSPGYQPNHHKRFERRVVDDCISCHSGRPRFERDRPNRFLDPPFSEVSIGCERCHGPGQAHVQRHRLPELASGPDPIVNPAHLDARLRESVCNQCHIQGIRRILRYGRNDFDFRPGDDLSEVWTIFVNGSQVSNGSTRIVSHVEQMRESSCYQKSNGQLGCISCHDPHRRPPANSISEYYRTKCLVCHEQQEPACKIPLQKRDEQAKNSCIECHMPSLAAQQVAHTTQTDHRIQRSPKPIASFEQVSDLGGHIFDDAEHRLPAMELQRARGLFLSQAAGFTNDVSLAKDGLALLLHLVDSSSDDFEVMEAIAWTYRAQRHDANARSLWEGILKLQPDRETSLEGLAYLCHETNDFPAGVAYFDRLIAINPWKAEYFGRRAHMLGQLGRLDEAIESAKQAIELNPSSKYTHAWLIEAYRRQGKPELARPVEEKWIDLPNE